MIPTTEKLKGTLLQDPDLRFTPMGRAVANAQIKTENEEIVPVVFWASAAESAARKLKRGDTITLHGYFKEREWTDKNGNNHRIKEFNINPR